MPTWASVKSTLRISGGKSHACTFGSPKPNNDGPSTIPATISARTGGCPSLPVNNPTRRTASRMTAICKKKRTAMSSSVTGLLPHSHPGFGLFHERRAFRARLPDRRAFGMGPRSDGHRVDILVAVVLGPRLLPLENPAKRQDGRRWLMFVDTAGEHVSHMIGVATMHALGERERPLPEEVEGIFQDVDPFLAHELVLGKRVGGVAVGALQVGLDERSGKLRLPYR